MPSRAALAALLALAFGGCGGPPPLAFVPRPVPVGHDGAEVLDVVALDPDGDGDLDLLVATSERLAYLRRDERGWHDETPGTALDRLAPVQRLVAQGLDAWARRGETTVRLEYSGIGSWHERSDALPDATIAAQLDGAADAPGPATRIEADLNGDGVPDEARFEGRGLRIGLGLAGARGLLQVAGATGADGLLLRGEPRRLLAGDLDGNGHVDLLGVGGRMVAWLNNGGTLALDAQRAAALGERLPGAQGEADDGARDGAAGATGAGPQGWFTEITAQAGLQFTHVEGADQWDIRPTMGPGAAFADVDGDGDQDLYVVGGTEQSGRLWLNDGRGVFTDVTEAQGLLRTGAAGMGASFADWDDDGDPDLYVTNDGPNVMWRNDGGRFIDITESAGTGDAGWGASVAWADIDGDGDLDLFVANYLRFDLSLIPPESERPSQRREDPIAMLPYVFPGQDDVLYRNRGDGTFEDITARAGLSGAPGKGLGALWFDHDDDGRPDLYVANDTTPNVLWHNLGRGADGVPRFAEIALHVGLDDPRGGMGLAAGDIDEDGDEDLFATYWQLEPNGLYRNNAVHRASARSFMPRFEDIAVPAGLAQSSVGFVGWGCVLADLDGDVDLDLYVANGYTSPDYETTMRCVPQPDHLYENVTVPGSLRTHRDVPRWQLVPPERAGEPFARAWASRGVAAADVDGDGDLDLAITNNNGPLQLLRNERGGRYVHVLPEGDGAAVSREAVGARVTLRCTDGSEQHAIVRRGDSYLSGHERGVRFGLGARTPAALLVAWPDGRRTEHAVAGPGVLRVTLLPR